MWPPEHLAFAYLLTSVVLRFTTDRPPGRAEAFVVVLASQLPDLVDKPLAWGLSVLPSGRSLAHSMFTLAPLSLLVVALAVRRDRAAAGIAFVVAYASHLAGDIAYPLVVDGELRYDFLFWPLRSDAAGSADATAFLPHVRELVVEFLGFLASPRGVAYLGIDVIFFTLVVLLWAVDGAPGLPDRHG